MHLVVFIPAILILIIVHEIGHMLAAKLCRIPVEEFGIGLPPRILYFFKWGETEFTLNALPLGGFVRLRGDGDPDDPDGLTQASPWKRISIYLAGPLTNILLGVALYIIMAHQVGEAIPNTVTVMQVNPGSPAEAAGLQRGDHLISAGGIEIATLTDMQEAAIEKSGAEIELLIERDGEQMAVRLTPRMNPSAGEGPVGITMRSQRRPLTWGQALPIGLQSAGHHILSLIVWPKELVKGQSAAVGLTGMYRMFTTAVATDGEAAAEQLPSISVMSFFTAVTLSLGVLNLFPIPALDGGRILFTLPEILVRRRFPILLEQTLNAAFFMILMAIMLYINLREVV